MTAAAVNYAFYTHLTKYYSNSAEHNFLLITINGQCKVPDTGKGRDTDLITSDYIGLLPKHHGYS